MTLTFAQIMASADIDPIEALVIRHAYVREHEDGTVGIHGDSSDAEIMAYTRVQSANTRTFPGRASSASTTRASCQGSGAANIRARTDRIHPNSSASPATMTA